MPKSKPTSDNHCVMSTPRLFPFSRALDLTDPSERRPERCICCASDTKPDCGRAPQRSSQKPINRRDAMDAEKRRQSGTSASIALLRFSLATDLVAASPRCAIALVALALCSVLPENASAQVGVASRVSLVSCLHEMHPGETLPPESGLQTSVNYRWLDSDRPFIGAEEQKQQEAEGSQMINHSHFIDLALTYAFNPRFSATLT